MLVSMLLWWVFGVGVVLALATTWFMFQDQQGGGGGAAVAMLFRPWLVVVCHWSVQSPLNARSVQSPLKVRSKSVQFERTSSGLRADFERTLDGL
eukprot:scaffold12427_cov51-Cyclotella_meneghiniana.AAC.5